VTDAERRPGLRPLPVEEWSEEALAVLPGYLRRPELYLSGGDDAAPMPQALRVFAHHHELGARWMAFTNLLAGEESTLDPAIRELAILRVAWRAGSEYEWKQHVRIGSAAGLTTEQLYAIPEGPSSALWSPLERAVLEASDGIVDHCRIGSETFESLAAQLGEAQLLELCFLIGSYLCFAAVANSIGMVADPPTEVVDAPEMTTS
jgi:alkylhydroperoxidase family enzyme